MHFDVAVMLGIGFSPPPILIPPSAFVVAIGACSSKILKSATAAAVDRRASLLRTSSRGHIGAARRSLSFPRQSRLSSPWRRATGRIPRFKPASPQSSRLPASLPPSLSSLLQKPEPLSFSIPVFANGSKVSAEIAWDGFESAERKCSSISFHSAPGCAGRPYMTYLRPPWNITHVPTSWMLSAADLPASARCEEGCAADCGSAARCIVRNNTNQCVCPGSLAFDVKARRCLDGPAVISEDPLPARDPCATITCPANGFCLVKNEQSLHCCVQAHLPPQRRVCSGGWHAYVSLQERIRDEEQQLHRIAPDWIASGAHNNSNSPHGGFVDSARMRQEHQLRAG
ncbi:unnamed protein product [Closterium sp. NIES-54]